MMTLPIASRALRMTFSAAAFCTVSALTSVGTVGAQDVDRTTPPAVPAAKPITFPTAQRRALANGIPVVVLEDHHLPVVSVTAVLELSPSLAPPGKRGIAGIVTSMLDEGTTTKTADQLADAVAVLGSSVSPFGFYTITANVTPSLALMADELLHPAFPESALARTKANTAAEIRESKENPGYLARRTFSKVIYGENHPYAQAPTEAGIMSITRDDVMRFYTTYVRPPNITFVVAGDITPSRAVTELNKVFGTWARGQSGHVDVPVPPGVSSTAIYLYDRPHAPQSVLLVGNVGPRHDTPDLYAIELMNTTLGGAFTSRLNLNLREQHQYTYGANSGFQFRRVPEVGAFAAQTSVVTPKTDSALMETMKELRDIRGTRPVTPQEFAFAKSSATAGLPLQFETLQQRAGAVAGLVADSLPLDYYSTLVQRYQAVTLPQDQAAAAKYIDPGKLAIVVVGDKAVLEPKLKAAGIAPIVEAAPIQ